VYKFDDDASLIDDEGIIVGTGVAIDGGTDSFEATCALDKRAAAPAACGDTIADAGDVPLSGPPNDIEGYAAATCSAMDICVCGFDDAGNTFGAAINSPANIDCARCTASASAFKALPPFEKL